MDKKQYLGKAASLRHLSLLFAIPRRALKAGGIRNSFHFSLAFTAQSIYQFSAIKL